MNPLRLPRRWHAAGVAVLLATSLALPARSADDDRFFGTYCGEHTIVVRTTVTFLGIPIIRNTERLHFDVTATLGHVEDPRRRGLIHGQGLAVGEGRRVPFAVAGHVVGPGEASGQVIAPEIGPAEGSARLAADGDRLTVVGGGQVIRLAKSGCPNTAPTATIVAAPLGEIPWASPITLRGTASDAEDAAISPQRMVWTSSRDGELGRGPEVHPRFLSHGDHVVTFAVTDSGGRTATATTSFRIGNNAPNRPRILRPVTGATLPSGLPAVLRGSATDRESGQLTGDALVWRSDLDGVLGTGELTTVRLSAGRHRISLTATDPGGGSASAEVVVDVVERPTGNARPVVFIETPRDYTGMADTDCLVLTAHAEDLEDGLLGGSALVWTDTYTDATGADVTTTLPATGERVELCSPATTGHDTVHTLAVTATDSDGLASDPDGIRVYVIPGGLI
ncbi:MAG: hypothetical protein KDD11_07765 [Acidobacteria bacterium]|nr:hypothetical protein [Acidobacteriota bacterium]